MAIWHTAYAVALIGQIPTDQSPATQIPEHSTYLCLDDSSFTLDASSELAIVRFADREYRLPKRRSSIAIKYATEEATLYLDGDYAAFVASDRWPPGCRRAPEHK